MISAERVADKLEDIRENRGPESPFETAPW